MYIPVYPEVLHMLTRAGLSCLLLFSGTSHTPQELEGYQGVNIKLHTTDLLRLKNQGLCGFQDGKIKPLRLRRERETSTKMVSPQQQWAGQGQLGILRHRTKGHRNAHTRSQPLPPPSFNLRLEGSLLLLGGFIQPIPVCFNAAGWDLERGWGLRR